MIALRSIALAAALSLAAQAALAVEEHHPPAQPELAQAPMPQPGATGSGMMGPGMMGPGMMGPGMMGPGMMGPGMMGPGMMGPGMMGPGMMGPGMMGPGVMGPGMMDPGMMGPGMMGPGPMGRGGMMGHGMMGLFDRIEGRIAFLGAELKITEAQAPAWSWFADALRVTAKRVAEARAGMAAAATPPGLAEWLENREKSLAARLDSVRAIRTAFQRLNAELSDEQKRTFKELVPVPMRMM
ncbi:MAG: Spy/CpxP family protein refolding chaperone [Pseudomonadota bacterium]